MKNRATLFLLAEPRSNRETTGHQPLVEYFQMSKIKRGGGAGRPPRPISGRNPMLKSFALSTLLVAVASAAFAQAPSTIDDQQVCPIMTKKKVNAESPVVEYQGIKIRMCCDTCVARFNKYPEAYLDEKFIPQLNGLKIPPRKISQRFCPVYPDRVVTDKDPFVAYKGHKIYLFNKAAVKKWEKNPEKYAKPELLPQLNEPIDPNAEADATAAAAKAAQSTEKEEKEDEGGSGK